MRHRHSLNYDVHPVPNRKEADSLLFKAVSLITKERYRPALKILRRAMTLVPADARIHFFSAAAHAELGSYKRALTEFQHVLQLEPDHVLARLQLGLVAMRVGEHTYARETWAPFTDANDDSVPCLFARAMFLLLDNDPAAGLQTLRQALAADSRESPLRAQMQLWVKQIESRLASGLLSGIGAIQVADGRKRAH
jgi:tetratricopeptide (TPR) repeat protein